MGKKLVNLPELLRQQANERYRAVLVTGEAASGKSGFARKLAAATGAAYLDLLEEFLGDEGLARAIDTYDLRKLHALLKSKAGGAGILILDNADFLFNTWSDRDRKGFCAWLGKLDNIQFAPVLCVFAQDDEAFAGVSFAPASTGSARAIRYEDLQSI